ncbi:MAG: hypothetical protein ACTHMS_02535 [Jatrophihabitans sp.]|uniref:hypothetical protein n=1 Tax=Jatrophihabitans sp. TaxID=1932789 RepID=UPI003F81C283
MQLPSPVRAAVGLVALAADEARRLPDRAVELPMLAVSTALQASLRAQQRWAALTARGDEVLHGRPTTDEPPPWATFDDPVDDEHLRRVAERNGFAPAVDDGAVPSVDDDPAPRRSPGRAATPKRVSPPRNRKPSAFDDVDPRG